MRWDGCIVLGYFLDCSASMCGQLGALMYLCRCNYTGLEEVCAGSKPNQGTVATNRQLQCQSEASGTLPKKASDVADVRCVLG